MPEAVSNISQLIANLGFPIAVALICMWYINKQAENHKDEVSKMTQALDNNTLALTRILSKMGE